jgi:glucokinase
MLLVSDIGGTKTILSLVSTGTGPVGNSNAVITNLKRTIDQSALADPHYRYFFCTRGRITNMMSKIPLHVILYPKTALPGAAYATVELDK